MITDILYLTIERFLRYLPILVIAIVIAQFFRLYIMEDTIGIFLKRKARRNILVGSLLGLVTPGPLSAFHAKPASGAGGIANKRKRGCPLKSVAA